MKMPARHTAAAALLLASLGLTAHAEHGVSLSLELGRTESRSDQTIPYAYNSATNLPYTQNPGDGQLSGIRLALPLGERSTLALRYRGSALHNDRNAQVGAGDCDIAPTLGLISDCWDASRFEIETRTDQFDFALEFPLNRDGSLQLTPFIGARLLRSRQEMRTDYYYAYGYSNYTSNDSTFNARGLFAGIDARLGLSDLLYLRGKLNAGRLWGERDLKVADYELYGVPGPFTVTQARFAHVEKDMTPWTAEAELALGFDFGAKAPNLEIGYQGYYIEDLIDARNTNNDGAPMQTVGGDRSLWQHSLFARLTFNF